MSDTDNQKNSKHYVSIIRKGKEYVYEGYTYYDKELKAPRNKRVYLGIKDPVTGEIKKSVKEIITLVPVSKDLSYGSFFVMDKIVNTYGLRDTLINAFGSLGNDILTISQGIACEGSALYLISNWQEITYNSYTSNLLTSEKISELLPKITFEKRNIFFEEWIKHIKEHEYLAYDITSISSYSKLINSVELGYNRDKENLPQINLGLLYGEESQIPVYYQIYNGSIRDVNTIENLITALDDMNITNCKFVMDKGFYSTVNNNYLYNNNHIFSIAVPFTGSWAKNILDKNRDVNDPEYYSSEHRCYFKEIDYTQGTKKLKLHIFYDTLKKATEENDLNIKIQESKKALEKVKHQQETEYLVKYSDEEISHIMIQYGTYFNIQKKIITVKNNEGVDEEVSTFDFTMNKEAINKSLKNKGYLIIMTNDYSKKSEEIITLYRNKEVAENAFDDIKNEIDLNRLNIHSDKAMDGKMFLVFLSLIFVSYIRRALKKASLTKLYTYKEVIKELSKIKLYTYENGSKTLSILSSKQKKILSALSITENEIKAITSSNEN